MSALAPLVWKRVSALLVPLFGAQRAEVLRPWCAAVAEPSTAHQIQAIAAIECLTFAISNAARSAAVLSFVAVSQLWRAAFSTGAKYLVSTQDNILSILDGLKSLVVFCLDQLKNLSELKKYTVLIGRLARMVQDLFTEINLVRTDDASRSHVALSMLDFALQIMDCGDSLILVQDEPNRELIQAASNLLQSIFQAALRTTVNSAGDLSLEVIKTTLVPSNPTLTAKFVIRAMERGNLGPWTLQFLSLLFSDALQPVHEMILLDMNFYPEMLLSLHTACFSWIVEDPAGVVASLENLLLPHILSQRVLAADIASDLFVLIASTPNQSQQFYGRYAAFIKPLARLFHESWITCWESYTRHQLLRRPIQGFLEKLIPVLPLDTQIAVYTDMIGKSGTDWKFFGIDFLPLPPPAVIDALASNLTNWLKAPDRVLPSLCIRVASQKIVAEPDVLMSYRIMAKLFSDPYFSVTARIEPNGIRLLCGAIFGTGNNKGRFYDILEMISSTNGNGESPNPLAWAALSVFAEVVPMFRNKVEATHVQSFCSYYAIVSKLPISARIFVADVLHELGRDCRLSDEQAPLRDAALLIGALLTPPISAELLGFVREAAMSWLTSFPNMSFKDAGPIAQEQSFWDYDDIDTAIQPSEMARATLTATNDASTDQLLAQISNSVRLFDAVLPRLNEKDAEDVVASRNMLAKLYQTLGT
jgi:hypothetical protein